MGIFDNATAIQGSIRSIAERANDDAERNYGDTLEVRKNSVTREQLGELEAFRTQGIPENLQHFKSSRKVVKDAFDTGAPEMQIDKLKDKIEGIQAWALMRQSAEKDIDRTLALNDRLTSISQNQYGFASGVMSENRQIAAANAAAAARAEAAKREKERNNAMMKMLAAQSQNETIDNAAKNISTEDAKAMNSQGAFFDLSKPIEGKNQGEQAQIVLDNLNLRFDDAFLSKDESVKAAASAELQKFFGQINSAKKVDVLLTNKLTEFYKGALGKIPAGHHSQIKSLTEAGSIEEAMMYMEKETGAVGLASAMKKAGVVNSILSADPRSGSPEGVSRRIAQEGSNLPFGLGYMKGLEESDTLRQLSESPQAQSKANSSIRDEKLDIDINNYEFKEGEIFNKTAGFKAYLGGGLNNEHIVSRIEEAVAENGNKIPEYESLPISVKTETDESVYNKWKEWVGARIQKEADAIKPLEQQLLVQTPFLNALGEEYSGKFPKAKDTYMNGVTEYRDNSKVITDSIKQTEIKALELKNKGIITNEQYVSYIQNSPGLRTVASHMRKNNKYYPKDFTDEQYFRVAEESGMDDQYLALIGYRDAKGVFYPNTFSSIIQSGKEQQLSDLDYKIQRFPDRVYRRLGLGNDILNGIKELQLKESKINNTK